MTRPDLSAGTTTIFLALLFCAPLTIAAADPQQVDAPHDSASLGGLLKHSDIALMPEGTSGPLTSMLPLKPTVVAWGNDAVSLLTRPDVLKRQTDAYRPLGIKLLACNVWMLTATDRVLYSNRACSENHWEVREVCRALHYANIPFGLVVAGDDVLQYRLTEEKLSRFKLIVVPEPTDLTGSQADLLATCKGQGKAISWKDASDVQRRETSWISIQGSETVWALARTQPHAPQSPLVIHLLNQDYDAAGDQMRPCADLHVRVSRDLLGEGRPGTAHFFTPGAEPLALATKNEAGDLILNVPRLDLWGIIKIE